MALFRRFLLFFHAMSFQNGFVLSFYTFSSYQPDGKIAIFYFRIIMHIQIGVNMNQHRFGGEND